MTKVCLCIRIGCVKILLVWIKEVGSKLKKYATEYNGENIK